MDSSEIEEALEMLSFARNSYTAVLAFGNEIELKEIEDVVNQGKEQ